MAKEYQYANVTSDALQVLLTGVVGDGSISLKSGGKNASFTTACVHKEYLDFKKILLGELSEGIEVQQKMNNGYKANEIYSLRTKSHPEITKIACNSLETNLSLLDELGVAMWFLDDGTLHKNSHCYHLCTHAFSRVEHVDIIIPFLEKFLSVKVNLASETKKDGRFFNYCRINKTSGASTVSDLLGKYPINCYNYKRLEYMLLFEKYGDEIYCTQEDKLYAKILDQGRSNYYIVFEDDQIKIPEHTMNAAKDYVRKHYKEHEPN